MPGYWNVPTTGQPEKQIPWKYRDFYDALDTPDY